MADTAWHSRTACFRSGGEAGPRDSLHGEDGAARRAVLPGGVAGAVPVRARGHHGGTHALNYSKNLVVVTNHIGLHTAHAGLVHTWAAKPY
jgi:hypothetical protein